MTNEAKNIEARSKRRDSLGMATFHADSARRAWGPLHKAHQGLRLLFGEVVALPVERAAEELTEHYSEAVHHFRAHLSEIVEVHLSEASHLRGRVYRLAQSVDDARRLLRMAVAEESRRAKKGRRAMASWAVEAREFLQIADDDAEEIF